MGHSIIRNSTFMILEACVGNLQDAISAQNKGAHQIELCDRLDLDGNNPPLELIKEVTEVLTIPVKIIVNPKPYSYHYSRQELEEIKEYVKAIEQYNVEGIVFGPVDELGMPDVMAIEEISRITDLPITYHKAIDASPDRLKALEMLINQGIVKYILTSGGEKKAVFGVGNLMEMQRMIDQSNSKIQLIAAGRITDQNLPKIHNILNFSHYHGKLIVGDLS